MTDDLSKYPTFDQLYEELASFRMFTDAIRDGGMADLQACWEADANRAWWSPRRWFQAYSQTLDDEDGQVVEVDGHLHAGYQSGLHYLQIAHHDVMLAAGAEFMRSMRRNRARHMAGCPNGVMAVFAKGDLLSGGMSEVEADASLVAGVIEETAALDAYAQETVVAKVQRAVKDVKPSMFRNPPNQS